MKNPYQEPALPPLKKEELLIFIKAEIKKNGNEFDLNHIDVSLVNNFSFLFAHTEFNGDISNWNTSRAENMQGLFYNSKFNGDISKWDVSSVTTMRHMFAKSIFNEDISRWDVSGVAKMEDMFRDSGFEGDISKWDTRFLSCDKNIFLNSKLSKNIGTENPGLGQIKSYCLGLKLEERLKKSLSGQRQVSKVRL